MRIQTIDERLRLPSPAPQPQALAADAQRLWLGSWKTHRLYGIDAQQGGVFEDSDVPGGPVGAVAIGGELRMVCSEEDNNRYIRRYVPGHGFDERDRVPCPDRTGSFLAFDGDALWLSQRYDKRVLQLNANYEIIRSVEIPAEIVGIVWVGGTLYLSTWWGRNVGCRIMRWKDGDAAQVVADVPFAGISLTHDGQRFWTNDFKKDAIVAFELGS